MALILDGTNGLSDVDGTAGTPAIRGSDANTGIFFPAADTIAFAEGGVESMRLDSNGNVGIGTSSPTARLDVVTPNAGSVRIRGVANDGARLQLFNNEATTNGFLLGQGFATGTDNIAYVSNQANAAMIFRTNAIERMRIDATGNLQVGGATGFGTVSARAGNNQSIPLLAQSNYSGDVGQPGIRVDKFDNNTTTSQVLINFSVNNNTVAVGQINANGAGAAAFGSWSDRRLKENIVDLPSQLENICALRPVEFDYIESQGGGHQVGFIAQEMQEVYPDAVGERAPDGMLTIAGWSKTEARLVKAIQEQQAIIQSLTARIEALENQT